MEMKIVINGLGAGIPKTGFGINLVSGTYLSFRMLELRVIGGV